MKRNLAADTKRLLYSITAKNIHKPQCYLILALIPTFNSSSFNSLIELRAASILIFYWNINPTANAPSSFWIVERSPDHPASNMVSFRGQKKLWPRPDRSPALGTRHIPHFRMERKLDRPNFRKELWDCY